MDFDSVAISLSFRIAIRRENKKIAVKLNSISFTESIVIDVLVKYGSFLQN